ncbi:MAG: hypothetical protein NVS9B10_24730 [Nevskia sp.]
MKKRSRAALLLLPLALTCSTACLAGPGRAGLWEVTTSLNFGVGGFQISSEQAEQMRQFGLDVPGISKPYVARQCITPEQAAQDALPKPQAGNSGCELRNVRHNGNLWNADIACNGELQGSGSVSARFDSNEHFAGNWSFKGSSTQVPTEIEMSNPYSGRWLGETCGRVQPARR